VTGKPLAGRSESAIATQTAAKGFLALVAGWVGWSILQPTLFGDYADSTWPSAIPEGVVLALIGFRAWRRPSRSALFSGITLFVLAAGVRLALASAGEIKSVLAGFQASLAVFALVWLVPKALFGKGRRHTAELTAK
jgi:hypothetical protein